MKRVLKRVPVPASAAEYPTRKEALSRRLFLGSLGAAAVLSACVGPFVTQGEPPVEPPDAELIGPAGVAPLEDTGVRPAADAGSSDAEIFDGLAPPPDAGK